MDINKLTVRVTKREGGKKEMSIAQVKEVIRCLRDQIIDDTDGSFDLYSILHSFTEPE